MRRRVYWYVGDEMSEELATSVFRTTQSTPVMGNFGSTYQSRRASYPRRMGLSSALLRELPISIQDYALISPTTWRRDLYTTVFCEYVASLVSRVFNSQAFLLPATPVLSHPVS